MFRYSVLLIFIVYPNENSKRNYVIGARSSPTGHRAGGLSVEFLDPHAIRRPSIFLYTFTPLNPSTKAYTKIAKFKYLKFLKSNTTPDGFKHRRKLSHRVLDNNTSVAWRPSSVENSNTSSKSTEADIKKKNPVDLIVHIKLKKT